MTTHGPAAPDETPRPDTPGDTPAGAPGAGGDGQAWEGPMQALGRAVARAMRHMDHVDNRVSELAGVITDLATKLTPTDHPRPQLPARGRRPGRMGWRARECGRGCWPMTPTKPPPTSTTSPPGCGGCTCGGPTRNCRRAGCGTRRSSKNCGRCGWRTPTPTTRRSAPPCGCATGSTATAPSTARRVRAVLVKCELTRHIPFNNRPVEVVPPGPPALARHAAAVAQVWTAGAGLDVVRAAGPEPTAEQLAEADAYQRALYRSQR